MVRLLHISDTHLSETGLCAGHSDIDARERLETVLEAAAEHGPFDAVAVTGDIADDASVSAVAQVHELVSPMAPVVVGVPGNHDDTAAVHAIFGTDTVRTGVWQILGAATNVVGQIAGSGRVVPEVLGDCMGPTVLLMHHPIASNSTHEWFTLPEAAELTDALAVHPDPLLVLSGHTHEAFEHSIGSVRLLGAPSTFYGIAHCGEARRAHDAPAGARVVELADDGTHTTHLVVA